MSEQLARRRPALQVRALRLVVAPSDRSVLHDRISSRFDTMLADGLVKEVRSLRSRPSIRRDLPAMRSVGYRQVWDYLEGELPFAVLADKGKAATRQLARRQLTWLRAEAECHWLDPGSGNLLGRAIELTAKFVEENSPFDEGA